jgi:glycosyltransferase involved in cell wall biosynthesis
LSEELTRVLFLHNYYQQPGGEDNVFASESALLEEHGHQVLRYSLHNDAVNGMSRLALAQATVWNGTVYRELRSLIREERPQLAHFYNTFPLASPAAYYAARAEGVPVVQTVQNYRMLCTNAFLIREGRVCEDCLGKTLPWPGVVHACYRESRSASGVVATMLAAHSLLGTWTRAVDVYIAPTEFVRRKLGQGRIPVDKIMVKPNFVRSDPGVKKGQGDYVLFVGRLSSEKGVETMLAAWERLGAKVRLKIAGDGPLAPRVSRAAKRFERIEWLGRQPRDRIFELMKNAQALLFPSVWYEGFPMVIVEAYAVGLPVITSDLGSMSSVIDHGRTGLHFRPGDHKDLAAQVEWISTHPAELKQMSENARAEFEAKYSASRNYQLLMTIYRAATKRAEVQR